MVWFLNPNGTIKQGEYQYVQMVVGANITAVCFWTPLIHVFLGMSQSPYRGRDPLEAALSEDTPKFHGKCSSFSQNSHELGYPLVTVCF